MKTENPALHRENFAIACLSQPPAPRTPAGLLICFDNLSFASRSINPQLGRERLFLLSTAIKYKFKNRMVGN